MKIATPAALIFLVGVALMYFALRGWDAKYALFNGSLSGEKPK